MNIETKFDFNQEVYTISKHHKEVFIKCTTCEGIGRLETIKGLKVDCPKCYSHGGKREYLPKAWYISSNGRVGKIAPELYADRFSNENTSNIRYMLDSTGVGSGTLWREEELFASEIEAQEECNKRNLKLENKD